MVRYAVEKDSLFLADPRSSIGRKEGNFLEAKARWPRSQIDKKKTNEMDGRTNSAWGGTMRIYVYCLFCFEIADFQYFFADTICSCIEAVDELFKDTLG